MTTVKNPLFRLQEIQENNEDAQRLLQIGNRQHAKYTEIVSLQERVESLRIRKIHLIHKKNVPENAKEAVLESYTAQINDLTEELSNKQGELNAITRELEDYHAKINAKKRQKEATPASATAPAVEEVGCLGASCGLWGGRKTRRHKRAKAKAKAKAKKSRRHRY
jgi:chromosome segregation ATPase